MDSWQMQWQIRCCTSAAAFKIIVSLFFTELNYYCQKKASTLLPKSILLSQLTWENCNERFWRCAQQSDTPVNISMGFYGRTLGQKLYEQTDHLGNVLAVVSDEKASILSGSTGQPLLSSLRPVLSAYYNYYPFGQFQPGRYGPANSTGNVGYRFGYNGQENADEFGVGHLTALHWEYDARIARRWNVDPVFKQWLSPYSAFRNSPNMYIDPLGDDDIFNIQWV